MTPANRAAQKGLFGFPAYRAPRRCRAGL